MDSLPVDVENIIYKYKHQLQWNKIMCELRKSFCGCCDEYKPKDMWHRYMCIDCMLEKAKNNYFDATPKSLTIFSLYDYIIAGTEKAFTLVCELIFSVFELIYFMK